jgi:hypothetical protein
MYHQKENFISINSEEKMKINLLCFSIDLPVIVGWIKKKVMEKSNLNYSLPI